MSPMVAGNLFSIVFGRNLDAHEGARDQPSIAEPALATPQCLRGLQCYVDTLYLTAGATFLSILLSIWAGYRDRQKIIASRQTKEFSTRSSVPWEDDEERRAMIHDS